MADSATTDDPSETNGHLGPTPGDGAAGSSGRPALWRCEAATVLDVAPDDLPAAMGLGPSFPAALRAALAFLPDDIDRIVVLEAGAGGASEWLRTHTGAQVIAVESAPCARLAASLTFPDLQVVDGATDETPLTDGSADVVTLIGVVSLLGDLDATLAEAARVVRDGGHVVLVDLVSTTRESWRGGGLTLRSIEALELALSRHPFTVCDVGCGQVEPAGRSAEIAARVDRWIAANCAGRDGFDRWSRERRLQHEVAGAGRVLGAVLVASRDRRPRSPASVTARRGTSVQASGRVRGGGADRARRQPAEHDAVNRPPRRDG